jgi:hypothetical protein
VKRIALLALFFSAVGDFVLERGRIDLWLMTSSFALLLWRGPHALRFFHPSQKRVSRR